MLRKVIVPLARIRQALGRTMSFTSLELDSNGDTVGMGPRESADPVDCADDQGRAGNGRRIDDRRHFEPDLSLGYDWICGPQCGLSRVFSRRLAGPIRHWR